MLLGKVVHRFKEFFFETSVVFCTEVSLVETARLPVIRSSAHRFAIFQKVSLPNILSEISRDGKLGNWLTNPFCSKHLCQCKIK
jgi:hypothetical protein